MPLVVPVKFTYASRDLWFDPQDLDILEADYAICSTERGTEIGLVTADPFEVPQDEIGQPLKPVLRVASDIDLQLADDLAIQGDEAMVDFRRLVKELDLEMKPVGVEYLFGGEKAVFYFAAEERVDFRQLVKDLSSTLHIRVDMRQIGVRDETRLVGGYAQCGQELCCTRFGGQFEPVSIRMAKEQDLPLNSSKISGVCGRLMCCLRYEFEAYKDFKSRAPKKKTLIDTPLGKARIQEYDTPREQLVLRLENGKVFKVNLADMTCSEGCKKKAAEQGCNCRPDCVTRDVLERIESPEMRLALMELDRENGVDVGDGLSSADRLAGTTMPKRRRRDADADTRAGQSQGEGRGRGKGRGKAEAPEAEEAASGRRRRKRSGSGDAGEAVPAGKNSSREREAQQPQQQNRGGGMNPTRRRRRHLSSEEREDAFRTAAAREAGAAPMALRPPTRLPTRVASSATMTSAPRVRVVAIPRARSKSPRCPPWPIRSRMARLRSRAVAPEMAEGRPPRPRAALLATNTSCAKIVVARVRPTRARSAVAVVVPASRVKMVARVRPKTRPHRNRPPANSARKRI